MTLEEFKATLEQKTPPDDLDALLLSLWYDAKGDWEKSHSIIQNIETNEAALIHAYLHRKEGDTWNAEYWYKRAGSKPADDPLAEEWKKLVIRFL
jgi:hypothetical protein